MDDQVVNDSEKNHKPYTSNFENWSDRKAVYTLETIAIQSELGIL